jgi:uncharacterized protein YdiU (UPF0061 family)
MNMKANIQSEQVSTTIAKLEDIAKLADYSLMDTLNCDPDATANGDDHEPRQVFSGHYVPVTPTPIANPEYVTHSKDFFRELGFNDAMAESTDFMAMFSGDISHLPQPMRKVGWATGYALSIYGTEYIQQCPFRTGNGYGDGRAVSVLEAVINNQRWEMQLKGGGRTPYCRGGDGRAVLRSSIREFLAQEHMHALGVPTSRSLSLYVSKTEKVRRPWYSQGSHAQDPDTSLVEPVAISTRVAPSFIRVGQLELFGRRARSNQHPNAMQELEKIVQHGIDREYSKVIDNSLSMPEKIVLLAQEFRNRLTSLVANWVRVGFCQGNFNSDNCALGGYTLDYGPFGFVDAFHPFFQSWTGGGQHFAFLNQGEAAQRNFDMFCTAVRPLLAQHQDFAQQLNEIQNSFASAMQTKMETMWAAKLGLNTYDPMLFSELESLMVQTPVDYTIFFRELSSLPHDIGSLEKSFYKGVNSSTQSNHGANPEALKKAWSAWFVKWNSLIELESVASGHSREQVSKQMKLVNPKYSLREWFVAPAYQQASEGNYTLVRELQDVMTEPYAEQTQVQQDKYYKLKPLAFFDVGGLSHYSCSS